MADTDLTIEQEAALLAPTEFPPDEAPDPDQTPQDEGSDQEEEED